MDKLEGRLDDIVTEIALRIPPSDPARLACLALACKRLLWLLTRPYFRERYASKHGGPPFVGYFLSRPTQDQNMDRFVPTAPPYKILSPTMVKANDSDCWYVLDVRQSRVLLFLNAPGLVVWLPATGEHYLLPATGRSYQYQAGAVICAESAHCKHPNCATLHDFRVVFVRCDEELDTFNGTQYDDGNLTWTSTYSLKTNTWTEISNLEDDSYGREHPLVEPSPPVLFGDDLYFTLETHELEGEEVRAALKFDMTDQKLSMVTAPEDAQLDSGLFLSIAKGIAFAGFAEGDDEDGGEAGEQNILSIWALTENMPPEWNRVTAIDLKAILPPNAIPPASSPSVVGFMSGEPTIFIEAGDRIFTVDVETLKTDDVGPSYDYQYILPFKHLYMPESPEEGRSDVEITFEEAQAQASQEEYEVDFRINRNKKHKPTQGVEQYRTSARSENDAARSSVSDRTGASYPYVTNQSYITQHQSQNLYQQVHSYNMQGSTYSDGYQQPSNAAFAYNNAYQPQQPAQMFVPSSAPDSSQQPQGSAPVLAPPQTVKAFTPANPMGLKNTEQYHQSNTLGSQLYTAAANQQYSTASSAPYQTRPPPTFNQPRSPVQYQTAPPVPSLGPPASVPGTVPNQIFPHSAATNSTARFMPSTNQGFVQRPGLSPAQPSSPTQAQVQAQAQVQVQVQAQAQAQAAPPAPPLTVQTADTSKVSEVEDPSTGH